MANLNAPKGFTIVSSPSGEVRLSPGKVDANQAAMAIGDAIHKVSGTNFWTRCAGTEGTPTLPGGIFMGAKMLDTDGREVEVNYLPASTAADILICTDPRVVMAIQANVNGDDDNGYLEAMNGGNVDIIDAAPDAAGRSKQVLDINSVANTASATQGMFRLIGVDPKPGNVYGAGTDYTKVLCTFNQHQSLSTTGTGDV